MTPYEERAVEEMKDLEERLIKLSVFIATAPAFKTLGSVDRQLLREQREAMMSYYAALAKRIERFSPLK